MKYIVFLKDNIAVAKCCYKSTSKVDLGVYDEYVEITLKEYDSIVLPCKKINGVWVKTDEFPKIEYPEIEYIPEMENV